MGSTKPVARKDGVTCAKEISSPDSSLVTKKIQETITSDERSCFADVTLITSDKVRIPAVRLLLSMSSSYFEKLFSSDVAERKISKASVPLSSLILQEVLEFVHTDDCNRLRSVRQSTKGSATVSCKDVREIVELADAAHFTKIDRLVSRCEEVGTCVMCIAPHTACAAVQALEKGRLTWGKGLLREAVKTTALEMDKAFIFKYKGCDLTCGLMHLDARGAEDLFSSVKTDKPSQDRLFQILVVWASGVRSLLLKGNRPPWSESEIIVDSASAKIMGDRLEPAKNVAKWFDISSFKPGFISNLVEESGLVEQDMLLKAYRWQSTQLEERIEAKDEDISYLSTQVKDIRSKCSELEELVDDKDAALATTSKELEKVKEEFAKFKRNHGYY